MNHLELYNLLKTVRKNVRCPQCGKQYDFSQIKIRGIAEYIVFLELDCADHMPLMATVALTKKAENKNKTGKISSDDIIETYKFLKDFSGGFDKIFQENKLK
jgi:hypothetical protein